MKNLTHNQDHHLNRELSANLRKNALFLFSVISLLLNPILLRAEEWWLPQSIETSRQRWFGRGSDLSIRL